eukprot:2187634-Amphidinium_carterae.2
MPGHAGIVATPLHMSHVPGHPLTTRFGRMSCHILAMVRLVEDWDMEPLPKHHATSAIREKGPLKAIRQQWRKRTDVSVVVRLHVCQSTAVGRAFKQGLEHSLQFPEEHLRETWFGRRRCITDDSRQIGVLEQLDTCRTLKLQGATCPSTGFDWQLHPECTAESLEKLISSLSPLPGPLAQ